MSDTARAFAAQVGARLTLPSKSLLQGKEVTHYFTETNVAETFKRYREIVSTPPHQEALK